MYTWKNRWRGSRRSPRPPSWTPQWLTNVVLTWSHPMTRIAVPKLWYVRCSLIIRMLKIQARCSSIAQSTLSNTDRNLKSPHVSSLLDSQKCLKIPNSWCYQIWTDFQNYIGRLNSNFAVYYFWRAHLQCFDTVGWVSGEKIRPVKIEWWGAGVVVCLEWGANNLHMIHLTTLPPHHLLLH